MMALVTLILSLSAQAPAGSTGWQESPSDRGPVLSYGAAANAPISLRCVRPGILRADLGGLYTGEGPEPRRVRAASGRVSASYLLSFGHSGFTAEVPAGDRVMQAFRRSGRLRFTAAGAELAGEATGPAEIQLVAAYLRRCTR